MLLQAQLNAAYKVELMKEGAQLQVGETSQRSQGRVVKDVASLSYARGKILKKRVRDFLFLCI